MNELDRIARTLLLLLALFLWVLLALEALRILARVGGGAKRTFFDEPYLAEALLFHASFDDSADADLAKGDARIYTAKSLKRENMQAGLHTDAVSLDGKQGRFGGALSFTKKKTVFELPKGIACLPGVHGPRSESRCPRSRGVIRSGAS